MVMSIFMMTHFLIQYSLLVYINSDDDCLNNDGDIREEKSYAGLVKFSNKIAYGQNNCSLHFNNPWLIDTQNGFGIFIPRAMDCGSIVTVQCLPDTLLFNQVSRR